jgi:hypothetical protein
MKNSRSAVWYGAGSLLLGSATVALLRLAGTARQCGPICVEIVDFASLPSLLIARIFYPEGVHTGSGAAKWGVVFLVAGVLFSTSVWFGLLWLVTRRSRRGVSKGSGSR